MPELTTTLEERVKIGLYMKPSVYKKMRRLALEQDVPVYQFIENALEAVATAAEKKR